MKRIAIICRVYILAVLLITAALSPLPFPIAAAALAFLLLYPLLHHLPSRLDLPVHIAAAFLVPVLSAPVIGYLAFKPLVAQILSALLALPVLYLVDYQLLLHAASLDDVVIKRQHHRRLTTTAKALITAAAAMLMIATLLGNTALLIAGVFFGLYLFIVLSTAFLGIPGDFLSLNTLWRRMVAGSTAAISLSGSSRASMKLPCLITPVENWVKATPRRFTLDRAIVVDIRVTPPLAGPARPRLLFSAIDPRGLIQTNLTLQPFELHVIPRARFAEWLARQYLERAGALAGALVSTFPEVRMLKRGIEYYGSRPYQPGDMLKDIDWKHTLKLDRLIIKEYIEASERVAIIAVNLSVSDSEQADKLAYNLISTTLTLAQENIPTALAAYNHQKIVTVTPVLNPREILQRSLMLVKDITILELAPRVLQPPDLTRLKRDISHLKLAQSEPARRLLNLLVFEWEAIKNSVRTHPAATALMSVAEHVPAPATVIIVSELNHDAEALMLTLEKLKRQDFTTIPAAKA